MTSANDQLIPALERWNESRREWERAKVQLAQARRGGVPDLAVALMKVQVDTLEGRTSALFEEAMAFMERQPLAPGR